MKEAVALIVLVALLVVPITGGILAGRASWHGNIAPNTTAILVGSAVFLTLTNLIHDAGLAALWLFGEQ